LVGWLFANAMRVRRSWGCGRVRAAAAPASSPTSYYKKTKVFKVRSLCRYYFPNTFWTRHTTPLPINTLKQNHWGGRGAGTPAPQLRLAQEKFGVGKI